MQFYKDGFRGGSPDVRQAAPNRRNRGVNEPLPEKVDVLISGMTYAAQAGAAGVPALTIPAGLDPAGRPQGVVLSGDYLSDPKLLALGYALEQQLEGRVEPDLDAVISTFP